MNNGKGNKAAQRQRRAARHDRIPARQKDIALLIDGNYTYYPVAYCTRKLGYLSVGLADVHRCIDRNCECYKAL